MVKKAAEGLASSSRSFSRLLPKAKYMKRPRSDMLAPGSGGGPLVLVGVVVDDDDAVVEGIMSAACHLEHAPGDRRAP